MRALPFRLSVFLLFCFVIFSCEAMDVLEFSGQKEEKEIIEDEGWKVIVERKVITDEEGNDIPDNEGVQSVLTNADAIINLKYEIKAPFNALRQYPTGTEIKGIVYSSTRYEDLFCPNNVSFWTYLSSMSDPNSYQYTRDISLPPYSVRGYAQSYYGQVCSSFVQYALGIKYNFQIHQMTMWDGLEAIPSNQAQSLMLGDVLTSEEKTHTRLVTGIKRGHDGIIQSVAISEGNGPVAFKREYPVDSVQKMIDEDGYGIYRYLYIAGVKSPPLEYDIMDWDDMAFNRNIMPRRGDKANWRKDEDVVIDILDAEDYSEYQVVKDDEYYLSGRLTKGLTALNLGVLPYGDYSMFLINGDKMSDSVYWIVADYDIQAKAIGNGGVTVSFNSSNATPIWITWRKPSDDDANNNNMPLWTDVINSKERKYGFATTRMKPYMLRSYRLGRWDFKVAFETQYGIISSDSVQVDVY